MKTKIKVAITGVALFMAFRSTAQTWSYSSGNTNAYLNPTTSTISFGTSAVPPAGIKIDFTGGHLRTNINHVILGVDMNHGIGYSGVYTTTGTFANKNIDGPVVYGFSGGALGSNRWGTKNLALRWLDNGFVGIGTAEPEDQLQVGNNVYKIVVGNAWGPNLGYGTAYIGFNMSRQLSTGTWTTRNDGYNNGGAAIYSTLGGHICFSTFTSTGATDRTGITDAQVLSGSKFFINGNGTIGIGTTTPSSRLQINSPYAENSLDITQAGTLNFRVKSNGYVYARDITVQATNLPDYVFAKEYKLMPLQEVRSFIEKNKHLPEMPTAAEVEKDGMNLTQINKLLVQKVEELTLYLLKMQEELDELKGQK
jgi:hypothetical protein